MKKVVIKYDKPECFGYMHELDDDQVAVKCMSCSTHCRKDCQKASLINRPYEVGPEIKAEKSSDKEYKTKW